MPISRVRLLMQFRMGSHALPVEQGRLAKPVITRYLRRCTLCGTRALGVERHFVFDCPHFAHIRRQFRSERERDCTTSIQPAWLMRTGLCSCLGHLQNGCEAMANSLLVLMPHEQTHGAFSILKQIGILSPDGTNLLSGGSQKRNEAHRQQPECCKGRTDGDGGGGKA